MLTLILIDRNETRMGAMRNLFQTKFELVFFDRAKKDFFEIKSGYRSSYTFDEKKVFDLCLIHGRDKDILFQEPIVAKIVKPGLDSSVRIWYGGYGYLDPELNDTQLRLNKPIVSSKDVKLNLEEFGEVETLYNYVLEIKSGGKNIKKPKCLLPLNFSEEEEEKLCFLKILEQDQENESKNEKEKKRDLALVTQFKEKYPTLEPILKELKESSSDIKKKHELLIQVRDIIQLNKL